MRIVAIIYMSLLSIVASAQCDTTGLLLELQATTNLSGLIIGSGKCFTSATIASPLYFSGDTLYLDTTGIYGGGGGGSTPIANNGVSDNEDGGKFRLGNRYMASPDAPFTMDRSINVDGRVLSIGDLSDSLLFRVDGVNDRVGVGTATPQRKFHVQGQARISNLTNDTPDRALGADSDGDVSRLFLSGLTISGGVLRAVDSSATNEIQVANNGLSDNESSAIRLGSRFMISSDGLFGTDRKVNINALKLYIGDNTDSSLVVVDGANDRFGVGTATPTQKMEINSGANTYIQHTTSGGLSNVGSIFYNSSDGTQSWAIYRQGDGDLAVSVSSDNLFPAGTVTDPIIIKPSPPSNSFYMDSAGKIQLGGTAPDRTLHVTGEMKVTDLTTTTPTVLVTADAAGNFSSQGLGAGLSFSGGNLVSTAGTFYQTFKDNGTARTQRAAANFISTATVTASLVDDAAGGETEVYMAVPANGITITQMADNSVNTAELVAGGVTYPKIQNVSASSRVLGRITAGAGVVEELTAANLQTICGYVDATPAGTGGQIAYFTDGNTITSEAGFLYDAVLDRQTINCTAPTTGAGAAILNIANIGTDDNGEFLQMRGNITNTLVAGQYNVSTAGTSNSAYIISQTGNSAGDPILRWEIAGASGTTSCMGLDNTDVNKLKISPRTATPGGVLNNGIIITNDEVARIGINLDAPLYPLDVSGTERAGQYIGTGNLWATTNIVLSTGAGSGSGGVVNSVAGGANFFEVSFTTGTSVTAGGTVFTATYPIAFPANSNVVFNHSEVENDLASTANLFPKTTGTASFILDIKAGASLLPSTNYVLSFRIDGY